MTTIKINGLDEITAKLKKLEDLKAIVPALKAGAVHVEGVVKKYPPSSKANTPGQKRWYQRNYGPKWTRKDGSIGGKQTSEKLDKKWTIGSRNSGLTWAIGNNVTYAEFVQSPEKQAGFHRARGWKTTQDVVDSESEAVVNLLERELDKLLES